MRPNIKEMKFKTCRELTYILLQLVIFYLYRERLLLKFKFKDA